MCAKLHVVNSAVDWAVERQIFVARVVLFVASP